jgi:hypothetical protein
MINLKVKTVEFILKNLKDKKIEYAVLRNFEKLPNIGRDLDLITNDKINKIEDIMKLSAKKYGWTYLILDETKNKNFLDMNKITMFYFIDLKSFDFLQVDLFKSLTVFGSPYYRIKKNNLELFKKKYYIISKKISYTYNLFQINSLLSDRKKNLKKIQKYRKNILKLNYKSIYRKEILFEETLLINIYESIKKKNFKKFMYYVNVYKYIVSFNFFIKNPTKIFYLPYKFFEKILLYIIQPSGFYISLFLNDSNKKNVTKDLNYLKKKNFILDWDFKENKNFFKRVIFLQQRNILINTKGNYNQKRYNTIDLFFKKLIKKNKILVGKKF